MKKGFSLRCVLSCLMALLITSFCLVSCTDSKAVIPGLENERLSIDATTGNYNYAAIDANDFQIALNQTASYPIGKVEIAADEVTGNFIIPGTCKSKTKQLEICSGSINGSLSRPLPANQKQAVDSAGNWYQYRFNIHDIAFTGSGSNGISLNCTYGSSIRNCTFTYKDTSFVGIFCLKTIIENCIFTNSKYGAVCFKGGTNLWQGAGASTSASNHPLLISNKVFNAPGAQFGIAFYGVSGIDVQDHISEGKSPNYHIIEDDQNSTTCWNSTYRNIHIESPAALALFQIKSRQGIKDIISPYIQYPSTIVDASSYAGAVQVNISNLCWIPAGSKFASYGNIRYRFKDLYNNLRVDTTIAWVGNKYPNVLVQENLTDKGLVVKQIVSGKRI